MVKKSLLWLYRASTILIGILATIVLATVLSVEFLLLPNIDQLKHKIADFASQSAKQKVVIGNIKADWQGVNLHLSLNNIDIFDNENRPALQLKNTEVSLSWLSIPMLEPHLANLKIQAPELTIRRVASGEIFVGGISMSGESKPDLPNWLLRQSQLSVLDAKIIWLDEMRGAPSLSLDHLNLDIFSPPWRSLLNNHRFVLSAQPSIGSIHPIQLSGSVYGDDVSHTEQWRGNVILSLKEANLAAFKPWLDYPINFQSGDGSTESSIKFNHNVIESLASDFHFNHVQMQFKSDANPVVLNKMSGKLHWENNNNTQSLTIENLSLNTNTGLNLQDADAVYSKNTLGEQSLKLHFAQADLAFISPYLTQFQIPTEIHQKISSLAPTGHLDDFTFKWQGHQSTTKSYEVHAKFNGLSIQAYEKIPGLNNFTGEVKANQNAGVLTLQTQNASINLKDTLRWPVPIDTLNGDIHWTIRDNKTDIKVNQLSVSNPHLSGTLNASYFIDSVNGDFIDLKGQFNKGNAKFAKFYYPIALGETTLHWLDTSILAGSADDINVTVKGLVSDFPYVDKQNKLDPKKGLFRVTAKVTNSLIEYGTGWPTIDDFGVNLLFEGKRMELNAFAGHLFGNQIIKSKTTIAQLDADEPMLIIDSELKGNIEEAIKFVNNSPVVEVTQGFTEDLKTSGSGKLILGLKIPMQNLEAAQYKGLYQINNGSMESPHTPTLTEVNGNLEFTENSLSAKNIKATTLGAPLTFNLNSGKDKVIRIAAKGKLNDAMLKKALGKGADYISGNTDWTGKISIQKPRFNLEAQSDLLGISSTLPAPLSKLANERLILRVSKKQEGNIDKISINLANKLSTKIVRSEDNGKLQLDGIAINFTSSTNDQNANESITSKGLQVSGSLDYLDVDEWRSVLDHFKDQQTQNGTLALGKVDLKVNALDLFDKRFNQLKVINKSSNEGFNINVQSRELTGDLQWLSTNNGKLIARLSHLSIPENSPNRVKSEAESPKKNFRQANQDYPSLDIVAEQFEFNKKYLGQLELVAFPKRDDWVIQKLNLVTPESTLNTEGTWNNWVRNPNSNLKIKWDIKDLGKVLKRFGYADTIKDGTGQLTGQIRWPGGPKDFDSTRLNGNLEFDIGKGQILKVQPGVGRLLGLLSLQSLPRRLTLDFRDLFSSGFAFDKINANVKIEQGIMRSDNFLMSGPAANVTIKGETNLQTETQHLLVRVMPNVSDSLSLAALAGGPLAGAVAFLAQKILKDPLNKIASTEYEITGTWDNPQEVRTSISNQESNKISPLN